VLLTVSWYFSIISMLLSALVSCSGWCAIPIRWRRNDVPAISTGCLTTYLFIANHCIGLQKVLGSLTLGGYDKSRFTSNDVSFPFGPDDSRYFSVGLQNVLGLNTLQGSVSLMTQGILSFIDSTVPHIWLPQAACDKFEQAFGLQYDPHTDLYLINDTMRQQMQSLKPTVTFKLGTDPTGGGDTVSIVLPYSAFDLQAKHPIYENATNYFPIRRAANDSQYAIGRTFLQEAYLIVDYERQSFSVSQAAFNDPMPKEDIVPIISPTYGNITSNSTTPITPNPTPSSKSGISGGAIAGIAIGVVAVIGLILAAIFLWWRKRSKSKKPAELAAGSYDPTEVAGSHPLGVAEFPGEQKHELDSKHQTAEMASSLYGTTGRHELFGSPSPAYELDGIEPAMSKTPPLSEAGTPSPLQSSRGVSPAISSRFTEMTATPEPYSPSSVSSRPPYGNI
jgi:hypothetical protein